MTKIQELTNKLVKTYMILTISILVNVGLYFAYINKAVDYVDCMTSLQQEIKG